MKSSTFHEKFVNLIQEVPAKAGYFEMSSTSERIRLEDAPSVSRYINTPSLVWQLGSYRLTLCLWTSSVSELRL